MIVDLAELGSLVDPSPDEVLVLRLTDHAVTEADAAGITHALRTVFPEGRFLVLTGDATLETVPLADLRRCVAELEEDGTR